jgi:hypothetical protein
MPKQDNRLVSLDVFRGLTIAGMVLVNNPGSWAHLLAFGTCRVERLDADGPDFPVLSFHRRRRRGSSLRLEFFSSPFGRG